MTAPDEAGAGRRPWVLLAPALTAITFLLVIPACFIVVYSFWLRTAAGAEQVGFYLDNWKEVLTDPFYRDILLQTIKIAAISTLICALMGYVPAYFIAYANVKNKAVLLLLLMLPFWISYIIRTMSWINILGVSGAINVSLEWLGIIDEPIRMLYNEGTVILGLVHFLLPFVILNIYVSLDGIDRNLSDAARSLGCTGWQAFREVTLPLSLPGLAAGCLLAFVLGARRRSQPERVHDDEAGGDHQQEGDRGERRRQQHPGPSARPCLSTRATSASTRSPRASADMNPSWIAIRSVTVLVYLFMFAPVVVVMLLSFNSAQFGSFPMEGFSFRWFVELWYNDAIVRAFKVSLALAALTSVISTTIGVLASLAMVRYDFPGKHLVSTALVAPILIPEVVLAVSLLLFLKFLGMPKSFPLLLAGHVIFTLPFVVLVVQARLVGIRREYEEASLSLGANPIQTFFQVTLPLMLPAVLAGMLFSFTISFDDITGTLFWKPGGVETVPTQIFSMLRNSISPEVNALGTVMVVVTVALPLLGVTIARRLGARMRAR